MLSFSVCAKRFPKLVAQRIAHCLEVAPTELQVGLGHTGYHARLAFSCFAGALASPRSTV